MNDNQTTLQPIVLKQENGEVVVKLVLENQKQEMQALTLANAQDNKINLDVNHSTDWVVVGSIIVSALISFIGFLITIYVVKKSTEQNMDANNNLIENQNALKIIELRKVFENQELHDLRETNKMIANSGLIFIYEIQDFYHMNSNELPSIFPYKACNSLKGHLSTLIAYIRPGIEMDEIIRDQVFELISLLQIIERNEKDKEINRTDLADYEEKFGYFQASLNLYIADKYKEAT